MGRKGGGATTATSFIPTRLEINMLPLIPHLRPEICQFKNNETNEAFRFGSIQRYNDLVNPAGSICMCNFMRSIYQVIDLKRTDTLVQYHIHITFCSFHKSVQNRCSVLKALPVAVQF